MLVMLATATAGATIRYTTDGSSPTSASPIYSGPILVSVTTTISAITVAPGYSDSTIATATFSIVTAMGDCSAASSLQISGHRILDTSGTPIVARGPEMVVAMLSHRDGIDAAAAMGANAARFLLTLDDVNGMRPQDFDELVGRAVSHHMIIWISLYTWNGGANHVIGSSLGGGNFYSLQAPAGTGTCSHDTPAPCYLAVWSRQWLKDLITKYQGHVIVDAAQEYIGSADAGTEEGRIEWAEAAKMNLAWFRREGYRVPLEIMSNYQGRDLYAIIQKGEDIVAADTHTIAGQPQTLFGWQAYWGVGWYPGWQGSLFFGPGGTLPTTEAVHRFAVTQPFPIQIGLDNYGGDTNHEYQELMEQTATDEAGWLWWSWRFGDGTVECPADGATCVNAVTSSSVGFAGAVRSACGP